jgi:hypothetical protein
MSLVVDERWRLDKLQTISAKREIRLDRGFEPDVNRTRNLLIWSQTRYHCATDPWCKMVTSKL